MAKRLITQQQYYSLTVIGKEIHDYWMNHKPKMYESMHKEGTLWETLKSEDERLFEMAWELVACQGLRENEMMEIIRAEIYDELMN